MSLTPSREHRFSWLATILVVMILGPIGLCIYWAADRQLPIEGLKGKFVGWDENNPRIGWIEWTGIRQRSCDGMSYRQIVNSVVVELAPIKVTYNGKVNNPKKKSETWRVPFERPEWFNHNASYRITAEYYCNALHKIWPLTLTPPDIPFTIPGAKNTELETHRQSIE